MVFLVVTINHSWQPVVEHSFQLSCLAYQQQSIIFYRELMRAVNEWPLELIKWIFFPDIIVSPCLKPPFSLSLFQYIYLSVYLYLSSNVSKPLCDWCLPQFLGFCQFINFIFLYFYLNTVLEETESKYFPSLSSWTENTCCF